MKDLRSVRDGDPMDVASLNALLAERDYLKAKLDENFLTSHKVKGTIQIGPYEINDFPPGGFWICKEDGEGMEVGQVKMIALIEKFWKEEF